MKEEWKDVAGYEGIYIVSSDGRIQNRNTKRIMSTPISNNGYCRIRLCRDGNPKSYSPHRLVAIAFVPNPLNKPEVNHKNGIKADNRAENLEWVTSKENQIHYYKNGGVCGRRKLSEADVRAIRSSKRKTRYDLSKRFGVSINTIANVVRRKHYIKQMETV